MKKVILILNLICVTWLFSQINSTVTTLIGPGEDIPITDGLSIDPDGNIYACDALGEGTLVPMDPMGTIVTKITPDLQMSVFSDGFDIPFGNCLDNESNLYVTNRLNLGIDKITPNGVKTSFANLIECTGITFDGEQFIYVAQVPNKIWRISLDGEATLFCEGGLVDIVYGIVTDGLGYVYVSNFYNGEIIKVSIDDPSQQSVFADIYEPGYLEQCTGFMDYFDGYIYMGGYKSCQVFRISIETGEIEVIAGTGEFGHEDGPGDEATFGYTNGVCLQQDGSNLNVYISDDYHRSLRKIVLYDVVSIDQLISSNIFHPNLVTNYPNPFNNQTTIDFRKTGLNYMKGSLSVYNSIGEIVFNKGLNDNEKSITIDFSKFNSGIYYYNLKLDNNQVTKKIVFCK